MLKDRADGVSAALDRLESFLEAHVGVHAGERWIVALREAGSYV
jgi:hypothetical protein